MKVIEIINLITTLYLFFRIMWEMLYLTRDMEKGIFIYWDKLHTLQHIAWLLWGLLIAMWAIAYRLDCTLLFIYNLYLALFIIPHFAYERDWKLSNFK
jgi:hypothetical protein